MNYSEGVILNCKNCTRYKLLYVLSVHEGYKEIYLFHNTHVMAGDMIYYRSAQHYRIDYIEIINSHFRHHQSAYHSIIMASISSVAPVLYKNTEHSAEMYDILCHLLKKCSENIDSSILMQYYFSWEASIVHKITGFMPNNLAESYNMLSDIFYNIPNQRNILHSKSKHISHK